ncbi:hypothetical protein HY967_03025 [Candidatus Jorgensenbacteria bacterium]|nr:hypothetical protein [Candidatus Jorgensenbacteria bacterium]
MMKKISQLTITIIIVACLFFINRAEAQSNAQIIFTWQAHNFYPANFRGKALPTFNTPTSVAVELLKNNKLTDLGAATITWYVDEKFVKRGVGQKEILFNTKRLEGEISFIRVIIDFNNERFETSTRIPTSKANVVITTAPQSRFYISPNTTLDLFAFPYFFNVNSLKDIAFSWEVNGQRLSNVGNTNRINIDIGQPGLSRNNTIRASLTAQNNNDSLETVKERVELTIVP